MTGAKVGMADVLALLRSKGIGFEEAHHPPVFTIEEMLEQDLPHPESIAKNLFLRDDKKRRYYLVVAREEQRVDLKALRNVIGSRPLSMASEDDLMARLGLTRGSVTPFGILNNPDRSVDLVIDSSFRGGVMGIHPNDNTCTVWVGTEDLVSIVSDGCASVTFADLPVASDRSTIAIPF